MRRGATVCILLLALGAGASCWRGPRPSPSPNILVILVDTLRFDRLGSYGSRRGLTPFIDSLAQRGYVFGRARAQSSWTNPSVASLFTSRYQSQHHVISFGSVLSPDELTLAEVLKRRGYATGAFCANILINDKLGFAQGFDRFEVVSRQGAPDSFPRFLKGRADAVNRRALAWLDSLRADGKRTPAFFLYVHYMEPHAPFDPPDELVSKVLNGRPRPDLDDINKAMNFAVVNFPEELVAPAQDFYDAEIMSLDAQLKDFFVQLQSRGFLGDTIVVFVADHGEEFDEHGLVGHHHTLYEEVIRVPFFLLVPGQENHREISEPVSLVDVAPTILDLADLPAEETFVGRSLSGLLPERGSWRSRLRGLFGEEETRPVFSELINAKEAVRRSPHEHAVILDHDKLIVGVAGEREYYDLAVDPGEKNPKAALPHDAIDRAIQQLYAYGAGRGTPKKGSLDAETRERMRSLGYDE